ncbi:MAG: hypothetical protein KAI71_05150 [Candidatus Pacebacteria bacterium]|nr:hypothetical protein [Candidatus Paceibacterota bacterium]
MENELEKKMEKDVDWFAVVVKVLRLRNEENYGKRDIANYLEDHIGDFVKKT